MSKYIDKDKLLNRLCRNDISRMEDYYYNAILDESEVDVVEVIRCKDCEWWEKQSDSIQGNCTLFGDYPFYPTGSWYCANGKRKENEQ